MKAQGSRFRFKRPQGLTRAWAILPRPLRGATGLHVLIKNPETVDLDLGGQDLSAPDVAVQSLWKTMGNSFSSSRQGKIPQEEEGRMGQMQLQTRRTTMAKKLSTSPTGDTSRTSGEGQEGQNNEGNGGNGAEALQNLARSGRHPEGSQHPPSRESEDTGGQNHQAYRGGHTQNRSPEAQSHRSDVHWRTEGSDGSWQRRMRPRNAEKEWGKSCVGNSEPKFGEDARAFMGIQHPSGMLAKGNQSCPDAGPLPGEGTILQRAMRGGDTADIIPYKALGGAGFKHGPGGVSWARCLCAANYPRGHPTTGRSAAGQANRRTTTEDQRRNPPNERRKCHAAWGSDAVDPAETFRDCWLHGTEFEHDLRESKESMLCQHRLQMLVLATGVCSLVSKRLLGQHPWCHAELPAEPRSHWCFRRSSSGPSMELVPSASTSWCSRLRL